jgi:hypothetical protein
MDLRNLIWIFFLLASLQPVVQRGLLAQARTRTLGRISKRRDRDHADPPAGNDLLARIPGDAVRRHRR